MKVSGWCSNVRGLGRTGGGISFGTSQRHLPEAGRRCDRTGRCSLPGSCTQRPPRPFAHGCSSRHWYAYRRACYRRLPLGGVWAQWSDPRCLYTRRGKHPFSLGTLVFLCRARVELLSVKPLAGSPQPACQERLASIGHCQWSAAVRGRKRCTSPYCWGNSSPCRAPSRWPASAGGSHSPAGCETPGGCWWFWGLAVAWGCRRYWLPLDIHP